MKSAQNKIPARGPGSPRVFSHGARQPEVSPEAAVPLPKEGNTPQALARPMTQQPSRGAPQAEKSMGSKHDRNGAKAAPTQPKKAVVQDIDDHSADEEEMSEKAAPLTKEWIENVRPYIDLVDRLREFGLDEDIKLPAVAVIGDQSSGKSSTLEAISGVQLPRGTGIVTRCPLEMRLKSTPPAGVSWRGRLFYKQDGDQVTQMLSSPEEVEQAIRDAQNVLAGEEGGISDTLIHLELESEHVPDLTLIDLPGIVRLSLQGQQAGLEDKIKRMIKDLIKKDETIVLAVIPANVDVATTEALTMAAEVDPQKERTLGVITKPDLVDDGAEAELIKLANNETYPLDKGFSVVKCRNQKNIDQKQSLQESLETEKQFFKEKDHFRGIRDSQALGVQNLSKKLSMELVNQIEATFPKIEAEVREKKDRAERKLEGLGEGVPQDQSAKKFYLIKLFKKFEEKVHGECTGDYKMQKHDGELRVFTTVRQHYEDFRGQIAKLSPDENTLVSKILKAKDDYRGRELPGFINYNLFECNARDIVKIYLKPAKECLARSHSVIGQMLEKKAQETFHQYARLRSKIVALCREVLKKAKETCEERIKEIFAMENLIYTQDRIFLYDLDLIRRNIQREQKARQGPNPSFHVAASSIIDEVSNKMEQLLGHQTSSPNVCNTDREAAEKEAREVYALLKTFMEICTRRLVDYIPMCITLLLVQNMAEELGQRVLALAIEDTTFDALQEGRQTLEKRRELEAQLKRLTRAETELQRFSESV